MKIKVTKNSSRVVSVAAVRKVNGELMTGERTALINAPTGVIRIVRNARFSPQDIERVGRNALRRLTTNKVA